MTEKDLDIAIEKCERIMEFDTRTLKDRESENGYIFNKVYELLKFLRGLKFDTDTKGGDTNDTISRQAAITEFSCCELTPDGGIDANYVIDFLKQLPPAQEHYLYGYNIESLVTIAEIMKREKISPEEALWIFKHDILKVVEIVRAEMQESIQRSFEQAYFKGEQDDTTEGQ